MRKSRFGGEQIIGIFLEEHDAGRKPKSLAAGTEVSDAKRLKAVEGENHRLKRRLAEQMLDSMAPDR
jgi:putative transposase